MTSRSNDGRHPGDPHEETALRAGRREAPGPHNQWNGEHEARLALRGRRGADRDREPGGVSEADVATWFG